MSLIENPDALKTEAKSLFHKLIGSVKWLWSLLPPLHPAGIPFFAGFTVGTLFLTLIWDDFLFIGVVLTLWCAYFFRDPKRVTPDDETLVIAPADGMVSMIEEVTLPAEFDTEDTATYTRVSIFLNVFDVHIQRIPITGTIKEVVYRPGKFLNACLDKASDENERSSVLMETASGDTFAFVQIAGFIARRIINDLKKDQAVTAGSRYGLIRFGSRVDLYLPKNMAPLVCVGQRMIGGETVMAITKGAQEKRNGVVR
jgi:phosphatidylserine decarboxylase